MTREQAHALVKAHAHGDHDWFCRVVHQIAAREKNPEHRQRLLAMVTASPPSLSGDAAKFWFAESHAERPWYPEGVERQLEEALDGYRYREALTEANVEPTTRLLLCGPPGCGKTMTARHVAKQFELPVYVAELTGIVESFLGQTGSNVSKAINAIPIVRAVWVLDEIDALASRRSGGSGSDREQDRMVNSLCIMLDRLGARHGGLIVGTTNRLDVLDPAIVRRFDEVIEWPEPTGQQLAAFSAWFGLTRTCASYAETVNTARREARAKVIAEAKRKVEV